MIFAKVSCRAWNIGKWVSLETGIFATDPENMGMKIYQFSKSNRILEAGIFTRAGIGTGILTRDLLREPKKEGFNKEFNCSAMIPLRPCRILVKVLE